MGGLFVVFAAWICKDKISNWFSNAIAQGIRRSRR